MKKHIISIFAAAAAICIISSCAGSGEDKIATNTNSFTEPSGYTNEYDSSAIVCEYKDSIEYYSSCKAGKEVCDKINDLIVVSMFGDEYSGMSVDDAVKSNMESTKEDYHKMIAKVDSASKADGIGRGMALNNSFEYEGTFAESYKDMQSYECSLYAYMGGAHPNTIFKCLVFDMKTGNKVGISDLLVDGSEEEISNLIHEELLKGDAPDEEPFFFDEAKFFNDNILVSDEGITWLFNTYEIAPYSSGEQIATISWDALKPYLKDPSLAE